MTEETNIELNKTQLEDVVGGAGMKGEKDSDMVRCPNCGTANTAPAKDGATIICSSCGKEFQI